MIQPVPKDLLAFSRILRKKPTIWELKLWEHLKNNNFGVRFKRQVRIGHFIVDFCCWKKRLIIEVDGAYHKLPNQRMVDQKKRDFLKREGYQIIRFWNSEIDQDLETVLIKIQKYLTPPPTPPLDRGGEL